MSAIGGVSQNSIPDPIDTSDDAGSPADVSSDASTTSTDTSTATAPTPDEAEAASTAALPSHQSAIAGFFSKIGSEVQEGEQAILNKEEPGNTSGFKPNAPPSVGVGALNIAETAAARLGLMAPLKNYTKWVDQGQLMRGSEQSDWSSLAKQGIKTVVNLRYEDNTEATAQSAAGIKNVWLPSYDQSLPTEAEVGQFLKVANDPANQPVYVHCEQGVGRTGVMCAAYRMQHDGWTADQAIAEAKTMGMNSSDQENYIKQLYTDIHSGKLNINE
jgi:protein tyrosine phosphatase (PTP) superfamily phosphohydrolase (DUF442 family)